MKYRYASQPFRIICILFSCVSGLPSILNGQETIMNYTRENIKNIATISPDSTNFDDLAVIGNAIGNKRIVMLGEQDHGDAPTFLAKTRMIKYLHEKKGFNVLAFESDFYGLNVGWDDIKSLTTDFNRLSDTFLRKNIAAVWTYCNTMDELLYHYIPASFSTKTPLNVTGFDNQLFLRYSSKNLVHQLDSVLRQSKIPITLTSDYGKIFLPLLDSLKYLSVKPKDTGLFTVCDKYLQQVKVQMLTKLSADDFWILVIDNLISMNQQFQSAGSDYWKTMNLRDHQMAMNLHWLLNTKFKNEKIIVWAHNYHISKNGGHYLEDYLNHGMSLGSVFTNSPNVSDSCYIMGFTSYQGTAGRLFPKTKYKVDLPKSNSLETWIPKEWEYAFLDFSRYNNLKNSNEEVFYMSGGVNGSAYHKSHKAQWNKIFDGVFYIKNMYPCNLTQ